MSAPLRSQPSKPLVAHTTRNKSTQKSVWSGRRQNGAIVMAIVAIVALMRLRSTYEVPGLLLGEMAIQALLLIGLIFVHGRLPLASRGGVRFLGSTALVLYPWLACRVLQFWNQPTGNEIVLMGSLAWGAMAMAVFATSMRTLSLSVVASGFLTLFTTFTSDHNSAIFIAFLWGVLCLGWLVANHWESMDTRGAVSIRRNRMQRFGSVVFGCVIFAIASVSVAGRFSIWRKLETELTPTSGGSGQQAGAARSGVGNGDALVAATQHAVTFGPVDSDIFLESPEPSLFDVYNETFGEPYKNKRWERAIGLDANSSQQDSHAHLQQSDAGGGSFDIRRKSRVKIAPIQTKFTPPLFYWIGTQGEHLAVERFDTFDGDAWTNSELAQKDRPFASQLLGLRTWFVSPLVTEDASSPFVGTETSALKSMKYRSAILPTPIGLRMWHIDRVDQPDFFALQNDGRLEMPNRLHVPDDTVIRMVAAQYDLARIEALARQESRRSKVTWPAAVSETLSSRARAITKKLPRGWEQIDAIVQHLRQSYRYERFDASSGKADTEAKTESLESFVTAGVGSDVMFATAAAVMLEEIGYPTRFVTGFYANPDRFDLLKGQTAIMAKDVHAWLEVDVGSQHWVTLEPTPGFVIPEYRLSLWHRVKLAAPLVAKIAFGSLVVLGASWWLRVWLFEGFCSLLWLPLSWFSDRTRAAWLLRILEARLNLTGIHRPQGMPPRAWLLANWQRTFPPGEADAEAMRLVEAFKDYFDEADQIWFGSVPELSGRGRLAIEKLWWKARTWRFQVRNDLGNLAKG